MRGMRRRDCEASWCLTGLPGSLAHAVYGGGFVTGSKDTRNTLCQIVSHDGPFVVVAVDYRRAPEFKCPVALEDCVDALDWVADNVEQYGGDPARICVAGDSAGGSLTLATVAANMARGDDAVPVRCQVRAPPLSYGAGTLASDCRCTRVIGGCVPSGELRLRGA